MEAKESHTIVLMQINDDVKTRTFSEFKSPNDALEGVCKLYECHLKHKRPSSSEVTYDIEELFKFMDNFTNLCCLVFNDMNTSYVPYDKAWMKDQIYVMLKNKMY